MNENFQVAIQTGERTLLRVALVRFAIAGLCAVLLPVGGQAESQSSLVVSREFTINQNVPEGGELLNTQAVDFGNATLSAVRVGLTLSGQGGPMANGDWYAGLGYDQGGYAVLLNRVGKTNEWPFGYMDNGFDVTFEDGAADIHSYRNLTGELNQNPLTGVLAPSGRETLPENVVDTDPRTAKLNSFDGRSAAGEWQLLLSHEATQGAGKLESWSVTVDLTPLEGEGLKFSNGDRIRARGATTNLPSGLSLHGEVVVEGAGDIALVGALRGSGTLKHEGTGNLILSEGGDFEGLVSVTAGRLQVVNTTGSATGSASLSVTNDGVLAGGGRVGSVVISDGGTLAPGSSPGALTAESAEWGSNGNYEVEINFADGGAGQDPGWDLFVVEHTLSITATEENPFTIHLISLDPDNAIGPLSGFDPYGTYQWLLATGETILGFSTGSVLLDTSQFEANNPIPEGWSFELSTNGSDLNLSYIPEPRTYVLVFGLAVLVSVALRRTRR